jgi:hypothetical protein
VNATRGLFGFFVVGFGMVRQSRINRSGGPIEMPNADCASNSPDGYTCAVG